MTSSYDAVSNLIDKIEKLKDDIKQHKDYIVYLEKEIKECTELRKTITLKTTIAKDIIKIIEDKIKYYKTAVSIRSGTILNIESEIRICNDRLIDNHYD
jgi:hypothetical protein